MWYDMDVVKGKADEYMKGFRQKSVAMLLAVGMLLPLVSCTPQEEGGSTIPQPSYGAAVSEAPTVSSIVEGLIFTEVMASSHLEGAYEGCRREDWFELYNASEESIDLSGYYVTDNPQKPTKCPLPEYVLSPGAYIAICCCGGEEHPAVDLGISKSGETLYLMGADGTTVDTVDVPTMETDVSWALAADTWGYCQQPTPSNVNSTPIYSSLELEQVSDLNGLYLNELLISNQYSVADEDGDYGDFVELYNGGETRSLGGLYLTDNSNKLTKWALPDITLEQGAYLVVFLDGKDRTQGTLHSNFSISDGEEGVFLYDSSTRRYTGITIPEVTSHDVSFDGQGLYYRYATPGSANGEGISDISNLGAFEVDGVYISEVCAAPTEGQDWVELHNGGSSSVSLAGWVLTDTQSENKYTFPAVTLGVGEYYVIYCAAEGGSAPFNISKNGETLYLKDAQGRVRDRFETGVMNKGQSSGRLEGDSFTERVFFDAPTPGATNNSSHTTGYASAPIFSETELYQTTAFSLSIESSSSATIYYTTDGSKPSTSSKIYSGSLSISDNTVIRAFATEPGKQDSEEVSFTYLFEEPHQLPVVCISLKPSDKDAVWSAKSKQSASKVEKEGYVLYYEADGKLGTRFPAGIKSKGAGTLGYKQPSLSIKLRSAYGQGSVTYPFFEEYGWETFGGLVVRNSGQDNTHGRIRDSLASRICFGLNIDVAATRPVVIYVNGQYYGLYDLNEDQNADYLETHYGIDKDDVEIIRYSQTTVRGSNKNWKNLLSYIESNNTASDSVYQKLLEQVDVEYTIDYLICTIYLCNSDVANQKYWHTTDNTIRWRPILYDFDYAMGYGGSKASRNMMSTLFSKDGVDTATSHLKTTLYYGLSRNPQWRDQFVERFVELIMTTFDSDRCSEILDQLVSEMEPEMARHTKYWGSRYSPGSVSAWKEEVERIRTWLKDRPEQVLKQLKSYFGLSQSELDALIAKYSN